MSGMAINNYCTLDNKPKCRQRLSYAALGLIFILAGSAAAASAQPVKLTASYTGVEPVNLPVVLAKEAALFAKNGLDVTVIRAQAVVSTMALISGEVAFIQAAAPAVLQSNLGGSGAVYVAGGYTGLDYWLVGHPSIKSGEQLKGAIIGAAGLSGGSFTATQLAVRKLGLNPAKDVSIVAIGGTPERLAALRDRKSSGDVAQSADDLRRREGGFQDTGRCERSAVSERRPGHYPAIRQRASGRRAALREVSGGSGSSYET
jgi:ABC-type nitrate/sulfonate/bicarbonate transport system substrate-binding protein